MKRFIAFSGGVESSTLALLHGYEADALFADAGFEHKPLYDRIGEVQSIVRAWHSNAFTVHRITSKHGTLPEYIRKQKFYPSFRARFCTRLFKIEPIDDFLRQFEHEPGGVELLIGLNADEADLRTGNQGALSFVTYRYPLVELGITRAKCKEILSAANLLPNFPPYMQRGGCVGCFYKSKKEFAAMALMAPDEFDQVVALEAAIQDERAEHYHIIEKIPNLKAFEETAQSVLFSADEMYPAVNDATACGIFCNR